MLVRVQSLARLEFRQVDVPDLTRVVASVDIEMPTSLDLAHGKTVTFGGYHVWKARIQLLESAGGKVQSPKTCRDAAGNDVHVIRLRVGRCHPSVDTEREWQDVEGAPAT